MNNLFLFLFATAGLVWVLNKSKLFKKTREFFTKKHLANQKNKFYWFVSSVFECSGCMAVWASLPLGACVHYDILYPLYPFIAAIFSVVLISIWQLIERK